MFKDFLNKASPDPLSLFNFQGCFALYSLQGVVGSMDVTNSFAEFHAIV